MGNRLENKVALVTGGGSGIGAAICRRFAEQGAVVLVSDVDIDSAETVSSEIAAEGGQAKALELDVSKEDAWNSVVDQIQTEYGRLNVLVNNAGIAIPGTIEEQTFEEWKVTDAVNVHGVYLGMQKCMPLMKEQAASIINLSSIDGLVGDPKAIAYNASKGSVKTMTKSAALHCAQKKYPIRVNSVHPGYILTPLVEKAFAEAGEEWVKEYTELKISRIPMENLGQPDDIAYGCVYLASDEAKYVTGSELVIDGGFTAS